MVKILMMHDICLSGLLGSHLSLKRIVVFLDIHFLILVHSILDLIMLFFGIICVILLTIQLIHVLIMHTMISFTLYHPGTILPYMIYPSL